MASFKSALMASSYQHPDPNGPYGQQREEGIKMLLERGFNFETLAEYQISWARDQDPFGHVMAQTYPHVMAICFTRLVESWQEHLQGVFPDFMSTRGIGAVTNMGTTTVRQVAKYPDLFIAGSRIAEVHPDRILVIYSVWSVGQRMIISEAESWVTFIDHGTGKAANLQDEGGVYSDLHKALLKCSAESNLVLKAWTEKQPKHKRKALKL